MRPAVRIVRLQDARTALWSLGSWHARRSTLRSGRALLAGGGVGALKLALALPFLGRYGWDRDELYFLQASRHLAPGYVDFPPMTALVGRVVLEICGPSLVALRLTGVLAGMLTIVLIALCVRELGGGLRSQLVASLAFALTPFGLGLGVLFHPTMLDVPIWVGFLYVALRILGRPEPRLLPVLGLIAGIGLETKATVVGAARGLHGRRSARSGRARSSTIGGPGSAPGSPWPAHCRTSAGRSRTAGRASRSSGARPRRPPRTRRTSPTSPSRSRSWPARSAYEGRRNTRGMQNRYAKFDG